MLKESNGLINTNPSKSKAGAPGVTAYRWTGNDLRQINKMDALGALAGGVAHDFNNLLTVINGYTESLLEDITAADPAHHDLKEIKHAANQAAMLTNQLLTLSRRQVFQPETIRLNTLLADTEQILDRLVGKDINLTLALDPEPPPAQIDPKQFEQVLINLATNARNAMPRGGHLSISTRTVILKRDHYKLMPQARAGRFICLSVTDTGRGMDKETIKHIFEPFFTTLSQDSIEGRGLGLTLVYSIVHQHQGWINVYSEPDKGSVFKVYLPCAGAKPADALPVTAASPLKLGENERILLVEDEPQVREFVARVLRKSHYSVIEADSAEQALEIFKREKGGFDLLFSDVIMAGQNGVALAEELLRQRPGLKIILSSGYSDGKIQSEIIRRNKFRFLQKPYASSALLGLIRETLDAGNPPPGTDNPLTTPAAEAVQTTDK